MTGGWVLIGDQAYRNSYAADGKAYRQPACWDCLDTGYVINTKQMRRTRCHCKGTSGADAGPIGGSSSTNELHGSHPTGVGPADGFGGRR